MGDGGKFFKKKKNNNNRHSLPEIPSYQFLYPLKFQILRLLSQILIPLKLRTSNNEVTSSSWELGTGCQDG